MEIDNCVVCGKYLKDIGEQEQGMCNKCDNKTAAIAKEMDKAEQLLKGDDCKTFAPDMSTTSATICRICGKEKWQHKV